MNFKISCGVTTDKGNCRTHNEDNFLIDGKIMKLSKDDMSLCKITSIPALCAVSDGMGGIGDGKEASYAALNALREYGRHLDMVKDNEVIRELDYLLQKVNVSVTQLKKKSGCTLALVYLNHERIYLANIGDSRIYLYKSQQLQQLSIDHNQAGELRALGLLGPDAKHGMNKLTQYLGMSSGECIMEPHYHSIGYEEALLLLCSDGLTEALSDEAITEIIDHNKNQSTKRLSSLLVQRAMERGAKDNITAMVISVNNKGQKR